MQHVAPEEFYRNLPAKRMAAGVLFFNEADEVLIVKPNYRDDGWEVPGGCVEENESPRAAAIREVKEEIGLDVSELTLLCVDYTSPKGIKTEALQFIFYGGVLVEQKIQAITLDPHELEKFAFVSPTEASRALIEGLRQRFAACLEVLQGDSASRYIES